MQDSSFGRMVGVLISPTTTFEAIARRPTWVVALVVLILVGTVVAYVSVQRIDMEEAIRESLERQGRPALPEERLESLASVQTTISGLVAPIVFGVGFYLLTALVLWVAFKMAGGDFTYKAGLSATLHAFVPAAVKALLTLPVVMSRAEVDPEELQSGGLLMSNLGFLASEDTSVLVKNLLTSVDLFSVWILALLTIGFSILAGTSKKTAAITAGVVWLFGILIKLGFAALGQAFGG